MTDTDLIKLKTMLADACVLVQDGTSYRICYCEENYLVTEDEDTGSEVQIGYDEIDLTRDLVYQMVLMNP